MSKGVANPKEAGKQPLYTHVLRVKSPVCVEPALASGLGLVAGMVFVHMQIVILLASWALIPRFFSPLTSAKRMLDRFPSTTLQWRVNNMNKRSPRRLSLVIFLLTCVCLASALSFPIMHAHALTLPTAAHDNTVEQAGLFSDQGALFDNQLEPTCTTPVTVSIRAYHNDLTSANLVYYDTSTSSSSTIALFISGQDATGIYDLWQGTIPASCSVKYYRFELIDGSATAWYNAAGASSSEPGTGDFYILPGFSVPAWARTGVMYQIMPDRFYNGDTSNDVTTGAYSYQGNSTIQESWGASPLVSSNGNQNNLVFYGGDLEGIDQKISYLKNTLGISTVYLMPIFTAPSNHKYDTQDYYNVDPHLGGNSALQQLVSDIHSSSNGAAGHVVLDGVFDHTGVANTWFTQAQASQSSPYYPYYDFQSWPNTYTDFLGYSTLPKLDYGSSGSAVRNSIYNSSTSVAQSWILNYGIDGWRLDAAQYLDAGGSNGSDATNHQIWQEFRTAIKGIDPNAFLYGEEMGNAAAWTSAVTPQWDAAMNYDGFTDPVSEWITGEDYNGNASSLTPTQFDAKLHSSRATYPTDVQEAMSNFLSSQDITRFGQRANGNTGEEAEAAIFEMTYEGLPTIFYGDEYGMQGGADPDNRRTFDWSQATTSNSLVALYQELIGLRKTYSSLTDGSFITMLTDDTNNVYAYGRMDQNNTLAVVLNNNSTAETITVPAYELSIVDGTNLTDLLSGATYQVSGGQVTLTLAAHSGAVLLKQAAGSVTPTATSVPTACTTGVVSATPCPVAGQSTTISYSGTLAASTTSLTLHWGYNNWSGITDTSMTKQSNGAWTASITIPAGATTLNMAFENQSSTWDSNGGSNYDLVVSSVSVTPTPTPTSTPTPTPTATATATPTPTPTATPIPTGCTTCTVGSVTSSTCPLVAGSAATIVYSGTLASSATSITMHWGYNGWSGTTNATMTKQSNGTWTAAITVPAGATTVNTAFYNQSSIWDNNSSNNYNLPVGSCFAYTVSTASCPTVAGSAITIVYSGTLASSATSLTLHWGYNNWTSVTNTTMTKQSNGTWTATITVPSGATTLNMAFENQSNTWDSNGGSNYDLNV